MWSCECQEFTAPAACPWIDCRKREPVVRTEDAGISNRIHVDDLVAACVAAIENKEARGVYNVTDGNSISSTAFIDLVAKLTGLPSPPRVSMEEAQLTFAPSGCRSSTNPAASATTGC